MEETNELYKIVKVRIVKVHCTKCDDHICDVALEDDKDASVIYCEDCYITMEDRLKDASKEIDAAVETLQSIDTEGR